MGSGMCVRRVTWLCKIGLWWWDWQMWLSIAAETCHVIVMVITTQYLSILDDLWLIFIRKPVWVAGKGSTGTGAGTASNTHRLPMPFTTLNTLLNIFSFIGLKFTQCYAHRGGKSMIQACNDHYNHVICSRALTPITPAITIWLQSIMWLSPDTHPNTYPQSWYAVLHSSPCVPAYHA
jgi:hypothetical protein